MAGIIFFRTRDLKQIQDFYTSQLGMIVWLEQAECVILKQGNLLVGFCQGEEAETNGMITLFYETPSEVDDMYRAMQSRATGKPVINERYNIYQFFARDPEGRALEFQAFLLSVAPYLAGDDLLLTRRSIRQFKETPVADELLQQLFDLCRYAPSARNSQPCYFVQTNNRDILKRLAELRGKSSSPIARAPMAIAICADPDISNRFVQDGCIAAYHFMLAGKLLGLGTCWIADMDRETAKEALDIPQHHYIATVTPLGYPAAHPVISTRHETKVNMKR